MPAHAAPAARPPVLLVEPPAPAPDAPPRWQARDGFELPQRPWDLAERRWICRGTLASETDAAAALLAVARGVGLAAVIELQGAPKHRFLEDLAKMGPSVDGSDGAVLDDDQRALLDALARGATVTAAAMQLHISRRTANRLLAGARVALGVGTTAAAVAQWVVERPT